MTNPADPQQFVSQLQQSQQDLLAALSDEDWQKLAELELQGHQLIESAVACCKQTNHPDLQTALVDANKFYKDFIKACEAKRQDYQDELGQLKTGQQAVKAYTQK